MEQNCTADCTHESILERILVCTWVMYELRLGVQIVYKHVEVHVFTYRKSHNMNRKQAKAAFLHNTSTLF